jgi:hypothetical protein
LRWLIDHPWHFFSVLLLGLLFCVNLGFYFQRRDEQTHSQIESARDGLNVPLGLLLGFTLPMAQPHYDQREELIVDEANAIATVHLRAEMLPEPFRGIILGELREYLNSRTDFAREDLDEPALRACLVRSKQLLHEMQQQAVAFVEQNPNSVTAIFVQALNQLGDLTEKRLAAEENRIPAAIWLMVVLIAVLASLVTGYSMRRRLLMEMIVLPPDRGNRHDSRRRVGQPAHWRHPCWPAKHGTSTTRIQFRSPSSKVTFGLPITRYESGYHE